jgi:hypothetical protein
MCRATQRTYRRVLVTAANLAPTVQNPLARMQGLQGCAVAISAAVLTTSVGAVNGGYFATSWGWIGLVLGWAALVTVVLRDDVAVSRIGRSFVVGAAAFVAWVALSELWSVDGPQTVLEIERDLVYVAGAFVLLLVPKNRRAALVGGCLTGIVAISAYALLTRLAPERLGVFDPIAGYRLATPLGYWNALGLFAGMGTLLALGVVAASPIRRAQGAAGAALVVLLPTLYFTFSRGSWIALGVGAAVAIALDPRRLRLLSATAFALPAPVVAVAVCWQARALNRDSASLQAATDDGHRVLVLLLILTAAGAGLAVVFGAVRQRIRAPVAAHLIGNCTRSLPRRRRRGPISIAGSSTFREVVA